MMALLFALLLITLCLAWYGKRRWAMSLFALTLILSTIWFGHHLTTHLNIQL